MLHRENSKALSMLVATLRGRGVGLSSLAVHVRLKDARDVGLFLRGDRYVKVLSVQSVGGRLCSKGFGMLSVGSLIVFHRFSFIRLRKRSAKLPTLFVRFTGRCGRGLWLVVGGS